MGHACYHPVTLTAQQRDGGIPKLPLMIGFGMPDHAETSSPIRPAVASAISLVSEIPGEPVYTSTEAKDCTEEAAGKSFSDDDLRKSPGNW